MAIACPPPNATMLPILPNVTEPMKFMTSVETPALTDVPTELFALCNAKRDASARMATLASTAFASEATNVLS